MRKQTQVQELRQRSCSRGQGVGVTEWELRRGNRNQGLSMRLLSIFIVFSLQMMDFDSLEVSRIMDFELFFQLPIIRGEKFLHIWNQQHHMSPDS